jgi:hypothetical protein
MWRGFETLCGPLVQAFIHVMRGPREVHAGALWEIPACPALRLPLRGALQ